MLSTSAENSFVVPDRMNISFRRITIYSKAILLVLIFLIGLFGVIPYYAQAEFVSTPDGGTLTVNGSVNAIIATSSAIYLGGSFTYIGPYSGYAVPVATSTGTASTTYPIVNGTVSSIISDGSGGWYIGGTFTQVGSTTRNNLAHIFSNGSIDTNFDPNVGGTTVIVSSLALSSNGSILYVGGTFTSIAGVTYNNLAAINTSDGTAISAFNPNMGSSVLTLALTSDGATLYAGGSFTTVNSVTYNRLAAIKTSDGVASTTFNPNIASTVRALALSSAGTTIYVGGSFTTVNGATTRNRLAAFTTSNGTVVAAFNPNMGNAVNALALSSDGTKIYAGGTFQTIGGATTYNKIAAINTSNGTAIVAFNPNIGSTVSSASVTSLALSSDGTKIFAGGQFTTVGASTSYLGLVKITTSNGAIDATFNPNMGSTLNAIALSSDGSALYTGGSFLSVGGGIRNRLAAIDTTGKILSSFDPNLSGSGNGFAVNALALSPDGSRLYAGGTFTTIAGVASYQNLAAINTSNGTAIASFHPIMNLQVNVVTLSSDGLILYIGGNFNTIDGVTYNYLGAINTSTGAAIPAFNPNMGFKVFSLALSYNDSTLYAGGQFSTVGGVTYNGLAAINTSNGVASTTFNPNVTSSDIRALALSSNNSILYAGGAFTAVGGVTYNRLAAINTSNGTAVSTFNPNVNSTINAIALSPDESKLYIVGDFTTVGGITYNRLASISLSNASATPAFNPNVNSTISALAILPNSSKLYVGGAFTSVYSGPDYVRLALFSPAIPPSVITSVASSVSTSTLTMNGSISAVGDGDASQSGFAYSTTSDLSTVIATTTLGAQSGTASFSEDLTGLIPNTTYYYRAYATNSGGTAIGTILSTSTIAINAPSISASAASSIAATTATLNGSIDDLGGDTVTHRGFEWGVDTSYGTIIDTVGTFSIGSFTSDLTGLTCATTYHTRSFATNSAGTASSTDEQFTTSACPAEASRISSGSRPRTNTAQNQINTPFTTNPPSTTVLFETVAYSTSTLPSTALTSPNQQVSTTTQHLQTSLGIQDLSSEFITLIGKFPELAKTITSLTTSAGNDIITKLRNAKLTLPGLPMDKNKLGVPIASLTLEQKKSLPSEVIFAKSGDFIDYNVSLVVSDAGEIEQTIHTVAGNSIDLAIKPDKPVSKIHGYLTVKKIERQQATRTIHANSLLTASIGSLLSKSELAENDTREIDSTLVLNTFTYTDPDKDGIYTAQINAPLIHGEYDIMTIMEYKDARLGSKEFHLTTVIDPEGYVYMNNKAGEIRIKDAKISIFKKNSATSDFELWDADKYKQVNPQKTDSTGMYSFLVPEGTYKLAVIVDGYYDYAGDEFEVVQGAGIHENIQMTPKHWWTNLKAFFINLF